MLLKVKARLEAEVVSVRREQKREVADREDELEDARNSAAKKVSFWRCSWSRSMRKG